VTAHGLSRIAGGVAMAAIVVVTGIVTWSVLRSPDRDASIPAGEEPRPAESARLGDLTGHLGRVDPDTNTIVVAAERGAPPVMLVVPSDASITVQGNRAALGELAKDMPVRVFYEVRNDVKHATVIQVTAEPTQTAQPAEPKAPAEAPALVEPKPAGEARPPVESKPAVPSAEVRAPVQPRPAIETRVETRSGVEKAGVETKPMAPTRSPSDSKTAPETPPTVPARPPAPPAVAPQPAAPVTAAVPKPPAAAAPPIAPRAPAMASPPAPAVAPAAPTPSRAAASRPAAADGADDGSAAVDWLLKGPGRR
jgi:hypothetical protein